MSSLKLAKLSMFCLTRLLSTGEDTYTPKQHIWRRETMDAVIRRVAIEGRAMPATSSEFIAF